MPKTNIFIESKFDVFGKKEKSNKFVFFSEKIMLKNVINIAFQKLREEEEFVDITLVSEDGREFKVHQVVLATACDKFKERMNRVSQHCQRPTILLKDTSTRTLQSFLDFIYLQEAHVDIEDSESFRRTAEWFGLKNELQWKRLLAFDENTKGKKMTNKKDEHTEEKRMTNKKDEHTQAKVFVHKNEKKKKMKRKRGEPEEKTVDKKKMLRLKNPRRSNACYVNSVLQLFQKSGLTEFLFVDPQKPLCSALAKLYNRKEEVQAKNIRMLVARISGRKHFAEVRGRGTQEDASSFLDTLEDILASELASKGHQGELSYNKSFRNQPGGRCPHCNTNPHPRTEPFLQLHVPIPASGLNHSLASILSKFFAPNTDNSESGNIKCSACCMHDGTGKKCTCSKFPSEDRMSLTKSPSTLIVHLLRYSSEAKIMTPVALEDEVIVDGTKYTIHGAIVHKGATVKIGHYVTYLKHDGSWFLHNDDKPAQKVGMKQIDNRQTYVLIAKKCEAEGQIAVTPSTIG